MSFGKKGFTLIELLVVISIISLLSAVVLGNLNNARMKARDARRLSDMRQIVNALELFYDKYGWYPGTVSAAGSVGNYGETATCSWDSSNIDQDSDGVPFIEPLIDAGFMRTVPGDPVGGVSCGGYTYLYYRYGAGNYNCPVSRGAFYVLGVVELDSKTRPQAAATSPGWQCNTDMAAGDLSNTCIGGGLYGTACRNWQNEFDWVIGGFEN
ncbi:MAG: Pili subunit [Candidatus Paceibacter sp.]|jgi:prepilin-type N-terminal cleavage/methylation domain-containing protein|nr:Pili subunit [Candidatus Paceibacter sp.]